MDDVLVVGGGPAGATAAAVLARAGARVRIVDRATFPRDKLCGDSLNPGTLAILRRLQLAAAVEREGMPIDGMLVTGAAGGRIVSVNGRYPAGIYGQSVSRRVLDWSLLEEAMRAGAALETGMAVREAVWADGPGGRIVGGVRTGANGSSRTLPARITIAADGRTSSLAIGLGLSKHPPSPRRWAIGAYFERRAGDPGTGGEMHIRSGRYIGVAPVRGGLVNVCLVKPSGAGDADLRRPEAALRRELGADPILCDRFAGARLARAPIVLGPLAVDWTGASIDGVIAAGDAAGFIDPITGDGLRFAVRGGELAALAALRALEHGWPGVHAWLAKARQKEFAAKWRFNRAVRALVAFSSAVQAATLGASFAPAVLRAVITYAGDCALASLDPAATGRRSDERQIVDTAATSVPRDSAHK